MPRHDFNGRKEIPTLVFCLLNEAQSQQKGFMGAPLGYVLKLVRSVIAIPAGTKGIKVFYYLSGCLRAFAHVAYSGIVKYFTTIAESTIVPLEYTHTKGR